jgi:flagellar basal body rod protein FlgG
MNISGSAFNSGISTIQSGQRRVDQAAGDIASNAVTQPQQPNSTPPANQVNPAPSSAEQSRPDLAESLVALRQGQNEAQAGAKVLKTADEVLGTLIDTKA